jgi:phage shock protein A
MAIFARLADVLKANINEMLDKAQDPEKMLKMIVIDMEQQLAAATQSLGAAMASERQMRRRMEEAQQNAVAWEQRAKEALQAGNEALARQAVESKLKAEADAREREKEHAAFFAETETMREQLGELKRKIEDTRAHEAMLIARVKMAEAKTSVSSSLGGGKFSKLGQLEEKVQFAEDIADAQYELSGLAAEKDAGSAAAGSADAELERLKKELNINQ